MRDLPQAEVLLRLARAAMLETLLPSLPAADRYTARLIANAMAIAAREMAAGPALAAAERVALAPLLGEEAESVPPGAHQSAIETSEEAVERMNWRLAAEIRGGMRDGNAAVHGALRQGVLTRLRETNPKVAGEAEQTNRPRR